MHEFRTPELNAELPNDKTNTFSEQLMLPVAAEGGGGNRLTGLTGRSLSMSPSTSQGVSADVIAPLREMCHKEV